MAWKYDEFECAPQSSNYREMDTAVRPVEGPAGPRAEAWAGGHVFNLLDNSTTVAVITARPNKSAQETRESNWA